MIFLRISPVSSMFRRCFFCDVYGIHAWNPVGWTAIATAAVCWVQPSWIAPRPSRSKRRRWRWQSGPSPGCRWWKCAMHTTAARLIRLRVPCMWGISTFFFLIFFPSLSLLLCSIRSICVSLWLYDTLWHFMTLYDTLWHSMLMTGVLQDLWTGTRGQDIDFFWTLWDFCEKLVVQWDNTDEMWQRSASRCTNGVPGCASERTPSNEENAR